MNKNNKEVTGYLFLSVKFMFQFIIILIIFKLYQNLLKLDNRRKIPKETCKTDRPTKERMSNTTTIRIPQKNTDLPTIVKNKGTMIS